MRPYWLDIPHRPSPPLAKDLSVDVVVIGAGLCGSSAALHLAQQGLSVALLEGSHIASSATGRNAGFILQGTAERYDRAVQVMGRERARAVHALTLQNHQAMAQAIESHGLDCQYQRRGSLQLASSAQEEAELTAACALLNADGFEARLIPKEDLPPALTETGHQLGVFLPGDGEVQPARFTRGIVRAAQQAGCAAFEDTLVQSLDAQRPGHVQVHTQSGHTIQASLAILATNARAGQLSNWLVDKVDPVRGQMLATAPLPALFSAPIYANHGYDYWRQTPEGRVVLGGWRNLDPETEVGHEERLHPGIQERMSDFLRRFPWEEQLQVTHRWSGTMGFSRDGLPLVGPLPGQPGALCGVGFTGHGFGFAFLAGQALAAMVQDGEHAMCTALDPRRLS